MASSSVFHKINRHDSPGLIAESNQPLKQEYACFAAALVQVTQYLNLIAEEKMLLIFFFWKSRNEKLLLITYILYFYPVLFDVVVVVVILRKKKVAFELLI